jgi:hypothetical protein
VKKGSGGQHSEQQGQCILSIACLCFLLRFACFYFRGMVFLNGLIFILTLIQLRRGDIGIMVIPSIFFLFFSCINSHLVSKLLVKELTNTQDQKIQKMATGGAFLLVVASGGKFA